MRIIECQFQAINFQIEDNDLGLGSEFCSELEETLLGVEFPTPDQRIQFELSNEILQEFHQTYENFSTSLGDIICDPRFNYRYDGAFINDGCNIGIEIQFRPDFVKDITRFQMGYHSRTFQGIVYIVAIDRDTINDRYTTMPQFDDIVEVLAELQWFKVPVLLVGINCNQ
jgi:hypothetical protein